MEVSWDPFADDNKADNLGVASSVQAAAHMTHHAVAELVAAWAFVAHTSYWDSSCYVITAGDCPYRVANISGRRETRIEEVCVKEL